MPPKRRVEAAEDKNEAPPAKTIKGEKEIESENAPPKSQQQAATEKKEDAPETADVSSIEASPAKIIKDKEEKKCSKVHELYGLLRCAQVMVDEDQEILRKCGEEDLFRSNWSKQWRVIWLVYDQLCKDMCKC